MIVTIKLKKESRAKWLVSKDTEIGFDEWSKEDDYII